MPTQIRPETPSDFGAIAAVVAAAFQSPAEAELVAAIRDSPGYRPRLSLVAVADGEVVGHVMLSAVTLADGGTTREVLSLSPLAVKPEAQRSGVGTALIAAALAGADADGEPLVVLEGSPDYYGARGFEWSVPLGITIELPDWAPATAAQVARLSSYDPSVRGRVIYPPAFGGVIDH